MKKTLLLTSFLFFIIIKGLAQDKTIDSLKLVLKTAKHDTTLLKSYLALGEAIYYEKPDSAMLYFEKVEAGSKELLANPSIIPSIKNIYLKRQAEAINNIGFFYRNKGQLEKALENYNKSIALYKRINEVGGIAICYNNIAQIYESNGEKYKALSFYNTSLTILQKIDKKIEVATVINNIAAIYSDLGKIDTALIFYTKSLKIREDIGDKMGISYSLNNIAFLYKQKGDISKALKLFSMNLKIGEEIGNKQGVARSLNHIGTLYKDQGDFDKAIEYYNKAHKINIEIDYKKGVSVSLNNIGSIYNIHGNLSKALEYYLKSLKIEEDINNKAGIASSLNNVASIYNKQENLSSAMNYYNKCLKINESINDKLGITIALNNIGKIYFKQKNHNKALEFSLKSLKLSHELGFPEYTRNSALQLKNIYEEMGNYREALKNYKLYIGMRDSLNNQETQKATLKTQFKYEYEKKAAADSVKVSEEKKITTVQLKQEKTQRFALYGGLALVVLFAGFIFNRFRVTQKQKHIIEIKEKETQSQNIIITHQKNLVEEKHREITDSINYAERIQRSFLATEKQLNDNLSDYFVLFKPKDVVSGDFYWSATLSNDNFALATADSTGHGVPGAIMSLLNVTSLEKAIEHYTNPADILNHTRQTIIERLKKDGSTEGGKDGMDCSLLVFNFSNKQLLIAAANNPVWIIRSNSHFEETVRRTGDVELIEIKPDKMPVGKSDRQDVPFTLHTIELQKGDTIYTLTDGFPDQFGGTNGKKFMSKKLKELLLSNVHLPISQQKELLETTFKNWIGDLEQVDDVCVIGIRI